MPKTDPPHVTLFEIHLRELGIKPQREYQFYERRQWKADWYFKVGDSELLVECEGGAFTNGRHTRGAGFLGDMEKYNIAQALGYRIFRFTPEMILCGYARSFIVEWIFNPKPERTN